ncbi:MAG: sensor histidine kinase [Mitsuokella sp.]
MNKKKDKGSGQQADVGGMRQGSLRHILNNTIEGIETSKAQIFEIYEAVNSELDEARKRLSEVRAEIQITIADVDRLSGEEQKEKQNLVKVSGNFTTYSEAEIRACYEQVTNVQIALGYAREHENKLREERDKLERRLRGLNRMLQQAEHLALAVGSVLSYLSTQLTGVVWKIETVQQKQFVGARIIKAQEDERYRISRDLHDGPAQDMAHLMLQTSVIEKLIDLDPAEAKKTAVELRHGIGDCLRDVRQVIFDMRPMALDDLGLTAAIQQLISKMAAREIVYATFGVDGKEYDVPKHVGIAIFRIVQEALNNIAAHSGTDQASVRMLYAEQALSVLIEDFGNGFDPDAQEEKAKAEIEAEERDPLEEPRGHFGMLGMKERARIIGAEILIKSVPGKGTRVHLRVPNRTPRDEGSGRAAGRKKGAKTAPRKGRR